MRYLSSPHCDMRPDGDDIDLIVLHAISLPDGDFNMQYIEQLFMGQLDSSAHSSFIKLKDLRVSAHFVVDRNGKITQFVATKQRAWHAGISSWKSRDCCNDYAIGIEMVGDEKQAFTAAQYTETARLCHTLMQHHPKIKVDQIVGHQDIAPGRKWDPGIQWDWARFNRSRTHIRKVNLEVR
ncbi:MAG: 1,6-anhydro-N-acetylmuramyl-L-alanine amidase AmpD [Mariprofundaceae bacterium]